MGLLNGTSVYLIGAIDHATEPRKWRKEIADTLIPMGVNVYDPLVKPHWFDQQGSGLVGPIADSPYAEIKMFKQFLVYPGAFPTNMREHIKGRINEVRTLCLRMAHDCNFMIGKLPKQFTVGTLEELGIAAVAKKPVLLCLPDGFDTSTWLPAQLGDEFYNNTFSTMEDLTSRLNLIDSGDANVDSLGWIFLSYFQNEAVKNEFASHQQDGDQSPRR